VHCGNIELDSFRSRVKELMIISRAVRGYIIELSMCDKNYL
jgi:hypothetical protein